MESLDNQIVVSIRCLTYNHAPYIRQCLDGFVMQKTNFRFEAIVHDDASTDGTQDIIREYEKKYPDIIKPIYEKENQYSKHDGSLGRIMNSAMSPSSKYIAVCEGDDFWTDPYKLQKQVNVLEQHPDCSICFAKVASVTREGKPLRRVYPNKSIPEIFSLEDFIKWEFNEGSWVFHTSSFMCRSVYNIKYIEALRSVFRKFPYGDITIQLFWLEHGNGIYIPDFVSCYRVLSGGYNSYVKKSVGFAIKENERKILGLRDYDNYTNFKYHQIFEKAILTIELDSERRKKNYLAPFSSKYLSLYKKMRTKNLITYLMNYYVPSLLKFLVSIKQTLYK